MINTTLSLSEPGGTRIHTYYFRTHFTVNFDPAAVLLVSSNYIDDGAVFYLNGHEYGRFNMDTNAVINYRSSALSAAAVSGTAPGWLISINRQYRSGRWGDSASRCCSSLNSARASANVG